LVSASPRGRRRCGSLAHPEVIRRQHVRPAQFEDEHHLDSPTAHPADRGEARHDFIVAQGRILRASGNDARECFLGDIAESGYFRARETGGAQSVVGNRGEFLRPWKSPARKQLAETAQDAFRRGAVQLLMGDGAHEGFKRRAAPIWNERAWTDAGDKAPHHGIDFAQVPYGLG
jgi:hypothetical protein